MTPWSSTRTSPDWTGRHTPLHATAAGKIFLHNMPEEQRRRLLKRPLQRFTESTIVDPGTLQEHIREVADLGYARTIEELEVGLNAVGAPICYADGRVVAAVSVSGPAFRMPTESLPRLGRQVRAAAEDISRCLGFRG
jgi:DNA-binding IclR family transcriptional regulator